MRRLGAALGLTIDLVQPPGGRPVYIAIRQQGVVVAHTRDEHELAELAGLLAGAQVALRQATRAQKRAAA